MVINAIARGLGLAPLLGLVLASCLSPSYAAELEPVVLDASPNDAFAPVDEAEVVAARAPSEPTADPTGPAVAAPPPFRVVVFSDLNSSYGSRTYAASVHAATRAVVDRLRPDLVLITGDMVAGQKAGLNYRAMWRAFHDAVTDPLLRAGVPVAPAPGNHDASPGFSQERHEYVAQWRDAARVPPVEFIDRSGYPLHYSFQHAGVFFAALDATAVGRLSERQRRWLDDQLAGTTAPVKIVFGHLPNHPVAIHREVEVLDDRELEAILQRHGVAAYISGHHHAYYPGAVEGVRHVTMPCLGAGARRLIGETTRSTPALVVMEIDETGIVALEALQAPDFQRAVDRATLPHHIARDHHDLRRDDLAGFTCAALHDRDPAATLHATADLATSPVR